jgi:hypothetical protein
MGSCSDTGGRTAEVQHGEQPRYSMVIAHGTAWGTAQVNNGEQGQAQHGEKIG